MSSSSSSSNGSSSLTKQLLEEEFTEESSSDEISQNVIQTIAMQFPMIISTTMFNQKRPHGGSMPGRRFIRRDRKPCHDLIVNDYLQGENSKYTNEHFRRRFRMDLELFNRILKAIENYDDYFTQKIDAVGNSGLSPLQKMVAAIRMLAYGCPADLLDEYVQIGESTAIESLKRFCDAIISIFEEQYLRKPNKEDISMLPKEGEGRGFSDRSPLFDDLINDVTPPCKFVVQGHQYDMGYYLSDGIYPEYATLIQTISQSSSAKEKLFAKLQEAMRKDVERAFGVLQSRWHIVKGPTRIWNAKDLGKIMKTCIILHNMIIESEHSQGIDPENWQPVGVDSVEDIDVEHDFTFLVSRMINRMKQVQDKRIHRDLKSDLINHLWGRYGDNCQVDF